MITIRVGSRVHRLLQILSVVGEFPAKSLSLLGSERDMRKLIIKLETIQDYRTNRDGKVYSVKLLSVHGKRGARTVRLHKKALPILNELHPAALGSYLESFHNHVFPGDAAHVWRNHRVAEAAAVFMRAGVETRPYVLPSLQTRNIRHVIPDTPSFYIARNLKKTFTDDDLGGMNKTMYTRMVGALFYPRGCYAVYNTRDAVMKWYGTGEIKAGVLVTDLVRFNAGWNPEGIQSALLLGTRMEVAMHALLQSEKSHRPDLRFDALYHQIHFVPMDVEGIRLVRILTLPDWNERILDALFMKDQRIRPGTAEYDAIVDGNHVFSHLDSDIARLIRFRDTMYLAPENTYEVVCYPWQCKFLQRYLGEKVILSQLGMKAVETALGIESIEK